MLADSSLSVLHHTPSEESTAAWDSVSLVCRLGWLVIHPPLADHPCPQNSLRFVVKGGGRGGGFVTFEPLGRGGEDTFV